MKEPGMSANDAVEIIQLLEQNSIEVYVDGGWGVDALLGEQTRKHDDLDIALPHKFVPKLRELFEARGYKSVDRNAEFLDGNIYERIQIQTPDRAQARIIFAGSGGGSGEVQIGYKFVTEDSEWIELFYAYVGDLGNNAIGQWENETEFQYDYVEMLNKLSPDERQFK